MIVSDDDLIAYGADDTLIIGSYMARSLDNRKNLTEELISEDSKTFKKFIEVLQEDYNTGILQETPEDLLRINIDKFLNENIVEYI